MCLDVCPKKTILLVMVNEQHYFQLGVIAVSRDSFLKGVIIHMLVHHFYCIQCVLDSRTESCTSHESPLHSLQIYLVNGFFLFFFFFSQSEILVGLG